MIESKILIEIKWLVSNLLAHVMKERSELSHFKVSALVYTAKAVLLSLHCKEVVALIYYMCV